MSVFDCFLFDNELDLLEIRLHELDPVVDRWVIVESPFNFAGFPKVMSFDRHRHRFRKFLHKIEHVIVRDQPHSLDAGQRERHQRNAVQRGLRNVQSHDIITLTDCDEIPRANVYEHFRRHLMRDHIACLNFRQYHYWLNGLVYDHWLMPKILTGWMWMRSVPEEIRYWQLWGNAVEAVQDCGWHFTWLGDASAGVRKLNFGIFHKNDGIDRMREDLRAGIRPNPTNDWGTRKVVPTSIWPGDTANWPKYLLDNLPKYRRKGLIHPMPDIPVPVPEQVLPKCG